MFLSELPLWPLDQGFRLRGYHLSTGMAQMGLKVGVSAMHPLPPDAPDALQAMSLAWPNASRACVQRFERGWRGPGSRLRRRLVTHQALQPSALAGALALVEAHAPSAVVGLGPHGPMVLRALGRLTNACTIWYAADELVSHQLSCLLREPWRGTAHRLRSAALFGLIERMFVPGIDAAVGVSEAERFRLRWIAGARRAVAIPNGVDLKTFHPNDGDVTPQTVAFWGRLDFAPNIEAVRWFAQRVWPVLAGSSPGARWRIVGKNPSASVLKLGSMPGVELCPNVKDVRCFVRDAAVAIMPMRCGGGVKNKLLEAAAMGLPIVATPRALCGLDMEGAKPPMLVCRGRNAWVRAIAGLWADPSLGTDLGRRARSWVSSHHRWPRAAEQFLELVDKLQRPDGLAARSVPGAGPVSVSDVRAAMNLRTDATEAA